MKHFSKYGLPDDSDDDDVSMMPEQPPVARQPLERLTQQHQTVTRAVGQQVVYFRILFRLFPVPVIKVNKFHFLSLCHCFVSVVCYMCVCFTFVLSYLSRVLSISHGYYARWK